MDYLVVLFKDKACYAFEIIWGKLFLKRGLEGSSLSVLYSDCRWLRTRSLFLADATFMLLTLFYSFSFMILQSWLSVNLIPLEAKPLFGRHLKFGLSGVCCVRTCKAVGDPALGRAAFRVGWQSVPGLTECKGGHSKWLRIVVFHIAQRYCWRIMGPWDNARVVAIAFRDFSQFSIWAINSRHLAKPFCVHPALCGHSVSSGTLFLPLAFSLPVYLRRLSQVLPP